MLMCCTAASAPPGARPLRMRISPMWLTSKTPTLERTALCSAIKPPLEGYSTGMSQPPKLTIFAPSRRCDALSGVLRSSVIGGVVTDSIPCAQAEMDTNMRTDKRQRAGIIGPLRDAKDSQSLRSNAHCSVVAESPLAAGVRLAAFHLRQ